MGPPPGPGRPSPRTWPAPCCSALRRLLRGHPARASRLAFLTTGHLRHPDHLRHPAARALRDGRRRPPRPRRRLRRGDARRRLRAASAPASRFELARFWTDSGAKDAAEEAAMSAAAWIAVALLGGAMAVARFALDAVLSARPVPPLPARHPRRQPARHASSSAWSRGRRWAARRWSIVAGGGTGSFTTFSTWMLDTRAPRRRRPRPPCLAQPRPLAARRLRRRRPRPLARRGALSREKRLARRPQLSLP